jgi:hypothetical protein
LTEDAVQAELDAMIERARRQTAGWGALVHLMLVLGAAREDATPAQRERMRKRVLPLIENLRETGDVSPIYRLIREIHGPDWRPSGEAADLIKSMTSWHESVE